MLAAIVLRAHISDWIDHGFLLGAAAIRLLELDSAMIAMMSCPFGTAVCWFIGRSVS